MSTIIIGLAVGAAVFGAVYKIRSDKKNGKCSCGGKCSSCPNGCNCHKGNVKAAHENGQSLPEITNVKI